MEYREGKGVVLFCQVDVTGRTEQDPAAETLARNLVQYVTAWRPSPRREALYVGDPAGRRHLEFSGIAVKPYEGGRLVPNQVLIVAAGSGEKLTQNAAAIAEFVRSRGNLLALGLDGPEANALLPLKVSMKKAEHISAFFQPSGREPLLDGVGPADVHNRAPRVIPLVSGGTVSWPSTGAGSRGWSSSVLAVGDGVLAQGDGVNVVFCQLPPYVVCPVDGAEGQPQNLRRTYRHLSFQLARLLGNMGVSAPTPLLARFNSPVTAARPAKRWLDTLYLDRPEDWDDPYRFFRW
jgi:hypothetical protein